jgi:CHASE2 domain-containing sensor protein
MNPAAKRYTRRFLFWMAVYSVTVIATSSILDGLDIAAPARIALALTPVLPTLMALREFIIFWRAMDEVQARINAEAILIAAGVVGFGSFAWGWVELWMDLPFIPMIWILPALIAVWGVARVFVSRRYQ